MLSWLWSLLGRSANSHRKAPALPSSSSFKIEAGLELERRLYESSLAGLDQTFAKESLVGGFLTSGALVALAACVGAYAQISTNVDAQFRWVVIGLFLLSAFFLAIGALRFARALRGWAVQDLSGALEFFNDGDQVEAEQDVKLKLIAEYRQARRNHEELIKERLTVLVSALKPTAAAAALAFAAVFFAFTVQGPGLKLADSEQPSHNRSMAETQTPKPTSRPPITLPKPGSGTTMIKGGGGNGSKK